MNATDMIKWMNERSPLHVWKLDEDVFCRLCDGVFKVQDVVEDDRGDAICPVCKKAGLAEFCTIPWWRSDLVNVVEDSEEERCEWRVEAIHAVAGKPGYLPKPKDSR